MKKTTIVFYLILLLGCAASKKETAIDLSKYDTNNVMSNFEHEHATATIYIKTEPSSADVFMDGKYVGKTNQDVVNVSPGKHEITLIKGDMYYQETMHFQEGSNRPLDIKLKKIEQE